MPVHSRTKQRKTRQRRTKKEPKPEPEPEPKSESEEEEDLVLSEEETKEESEKSSESEEESKSEETEAETKKSTTKRVVKKRTAKKAPAKKAPAKKATEDSDKKKRFFKILLESIEPVDGSPKVDLSTLNSKGGRYTGHNPMQAAKKACRRITRASESDGECRYVFSVQETTQGSAKKKFKYVGERVKLEKPSVIKKGDATYNVYFDINVRSYKGPESLKRKTKK